MQKTSIKKLYALILICSLIVSACQQSPETQPKSKNSSITEQNVEVENTGIEPPQTTSFLIDHCDTPYVTVLERDITKGNDSCILRIISSERNIHRVEVLNIPTDLSSIRKCEEEYVSVASACGGPCHSHVFVFTDENRPNEQYHYVQYVESHPNIITHIEKEEFEKLIIRNLDNGKEIVVENPVNPVLFYAEMDKLYISGDNLNLEYRTGDEKTKNKVVSLSEILR